MAEPASNIAIAEPSAPELPPRPFSDEALLLTDAPVPGRPLLSEASDLQIEIVTDWSRLAALEQEWQDLAAAASEPNPFYEPWMLLPALHAYGSEARLEVLLVSATHRGQRLLCGLFPLAWRRGRAELWKYRSCYPLRRQRARLAELGHLELCELRPDEDPAPWIREFLALEASGWKGAHGVAAALNPAERTYIEEMAARAHQRGRLMMMGLRLDGRPVALKYNLLAGDGAFAFKIAFDESFARYSPGVLLELENIHRLHRMPAVRWMDSCAAPTRFMINHLWPERREMQTVFFSTGRALPSLLLALVPFLQFLRARAQRRRRSS